ncbi:MAG: hypothetical protein M8357_15890 [Desulfobulbaceae bacterium]|nr:hypothetical protein [Desulfobulbaceae bacterium]
MRVVRIFVAAGIITGLIWLYWWVVPTLGIFTMTLHDPPLPENGYAIVQFSDGKGTETCVLTMLKSGWSIIGEIWPFALACLLLGLAIGYPLGELARRKFAIDKASEEVIILSEEVLQEAHQRELYAENTLNEARDIHEKTKHMKAKLKLEEQEVYEMKVDADIKLEAAQLFRQRADSMQEELNKAKAKIRRLEKKKIT